MGGIEGTPIIRYPVSSDISDKYFMNIPVYEYKRRKKCVIVSRFKIALFYAMIC